MYSSISILCYFILHFMSEANTVGYYVLICCADIEPVVGLLVVFSHVAMVTVYIPPSGNPTCDVIHSAIDRCCIELCFLVEVCFPWSRPHPKCPEGRRKRAFTKNSPTSCCARATEAPWRELRFKTDSFFREFYLRMLYCRR